MAVACSDTLVGGAVLPLPVTHCQHLASGSPSLQHSVDTVQFDSLVVPANSALMTSSGVVAAIESVSIVADRHLSRSDSETNRCVSSELAKSDANTSDPINISSTADRQTDREVAHASADNAKQNGSNGLSCDPMDIESSPRMVEQLDSDLTDSHDLGDIAAPVTAAESATFDAPRQESTAAVAISPPDHQNLAERQNGDGRRPSTDERVLVDNPAGTESVDKCRTSSTPSKNKERPARKHNDSDGVFLLKDSCSAVAETAVTCVLSSGAAANTDVSDAPATATTSNGGESLCRRRSCHCCCRRHRECSGAGASCHVPAESGPMLVAAAGGCGSCRHGHHHHHHHHHQHRTRPPFSGFCRSGVLGADRRRTQLRQIVNGVALDVSREQVATASTVPAAACVSGGEIPGGVEKSCPVRLSDQTHSVGEPIIPHSNTVVPVEPGRIFTPSMVVSSPAQVDTVHSLSSPHSDAEQLNNAVNWTVVDVIDCPDRRVPLPDTTGMMASSATVPSLTAAAIKAPTYVALLPEPDRLPFKASFMRSLGLTSAEVLRRELAAAVPRRRWLRKRKKPSLLADETELARPTLSAAAKIVKKISPGMSAITGKCVSKGVSQACTASAAATEGWHKCGGKQHVTSRARKTASVRKPTVAVARRPAAAAGAKHTVLVSNTVTTAGGHPAGVRRPVTIGNSAMHACKPLEPQLVRGASNWQLSLPVIRLLPAGACVEARRLPRPPQLLSPAKRKTHVSIAVIKDDARTMEQQQQLSPQQQQQTSLVSSVIKHTPTADSVSVAGGGGGSAQSSKRALSPRRRWLASRTRGGPMIQCPLCHAYIAEQLVPVHVRVHTSGRLDCVKCGALLHSAPALYRHHQQCSVGVEENDSAEIAAAAAAGGQDAPQTSQRVGAKKRRPRPVAKSPPAKRKYRRKRLRHVNSEHLTES